MRGLVVELPGVLGKDQATLSKRGRFLSKVEVWERV